MARLHLTRSRTFGIGLAIASIAFASCGGHSNSTPTPKSTVSAAPTATGSAPVSLSSPCASSIGIAYEPDGGNGNGFNGIQVSHFEDNGRHLCAGIAPTSLANAVQLDSSVGQIAISQDFSDAVALLFNASSGGYSYVQDLFGGEVGQLVPAGTPYNLSVAPTPVPTTTATSSATSSASPPALITNGTSETIVGDGDSGVALTVSPNTSPQGIVALTSLTNSPPQYGDFVPFSAPTYTLKTPIGTAFNNIRAETVTSTGGTATTILARGLNDLIAIGVSAATTGYQLNVEAEDTNLGSSIPLVGNGRMAIDPGDASRALVGGNTAGNMSQLTLVTGLPTAITETATIALPGTINSIAISPTGGSYAVVGTSVGVVVVAGVNANSLEIVTPFSGAQAYTPVYTNCNGTQSTMTNVSSVGLSADEQYLVALGTSPGVTCKSGYNASLVAVYFGSTTGATPAPSSIPTPTAAPSGSPSPSPVPTFFQQNNMIAPPTNGDFLIVH